MALRFQHGNTANVMVRVVRWTGTEEDAVYDRFSTEFLGLASRKVEKAQLLMQVHRIWQVPQLVLAARVGWTESKVTKHLYAATADAEAPGFAKLLLNPNDPPIDYLYKVQSARLEAAKDDADHPRRAPDKKATATLQTRLDDLLARQERFKPADALVALGLAKPSIKAAGSPEELEALAVEGEPEIVDHVMGHDDQPVATIEMTPDNRIRITLLIDPSELEPLEREEARTRLREALDRVLG
jgi:hypothetical protein